MMRKVKVAFMMMSNLRGGAGTEQFMLSILKNKNCLSKIHVLILQPDYSKVEMMTIQEIETVTSGVEIITYKDYLHKFEFLDKNKFTRMLFHYFLFPLLAFILKYTAYRRILNSAFTSDVVYLYDNKYNAFLKGKLKGKHPIYVGSENCWQASNQGIFNRIFLKLLNAGIIWRHIKVFHLYSNKTLALFNRNRFKIITIPAGKDEEIFHPPFFSDILGPPIFLFVGRLERCKGVIELINAWNAIYSPNVGELYIYGDGSLLSELRKQSGKNGVFIMGPLNNERLAEIYRKADYFVFPTTCDTFGMVVIEAAFSGLHIICSNRLRGIYDDLETFGSLEYVEPNQVGLEESLKKAIKLGKLTAEKKNLNGKYAMKLYSKANVEKFCDMLVQLSYYG